MPLPSVRSFTIAYLVLCHVLLYTTSPGYKAQLVRASSAALSGLQTAGAGSREPRLQPRSMQCWKLQ
jgi:hypothetical protein